MKSDRLASRVYLKAARLIDTEEFAHCCFAIEDANLKTKDFMSSYYLQSRFWSNCFRPQGTYFATWGQTSVSNRAWYSPDKNYKQERVLALLFASEMASTGDI